MNQRTGGSIGEVKGNATNAGRIGGVKHNGGNRQKNLPHDLKEEGINLWMRKQEK